LLPEGSSQALYGESFNKMLNVVTGVNDISNTPGDKLGQKKSKNNAKRYHFFTSKGRIIL